MQSFQGSTFYPSQKEGNSISERNSTNEQNNTSLTLSDLEIDRSLMNLEREITNEGTSKTRNLANRSLKFEKMMQNLTKGLILFILSDLALPYIEQIRKLSADNFETDNFLDYVKTQKELSSNSNCFQALFLSNYGSILEKIYKRTCQQIAVIFLKYFMVNWIFQSRLSNKQDYLRIRFKLIRMIKKVHFQ